MEDANDLERPGVGSINDEAGANDKEAMPAVNQMFAAATDARVRPGFCTAASILSNPESSFSVFG
jgi:hypothetical protein